MVPVLPNLSHQCYVHYALFRYCSHVLCCVGTKRIRLFTAVINRLARLARAVLQGAAACTTLLLFKSLHGVYVSLPLK